MTNLIQCKLIAIVFFFVFFLLFKCKQFVTRWYVVWQCIPQIWTMVWYRCMCYKQYGITKCKFCEFLVGYECMALSSVKKSLKQKSLFVDTTCASIRNTHDMTLMRRLETIYSLLNCYERAKRVMRNFQFVCVLQYFSKILISCLSITHYTLLVQLLYYCQ